MDYSKIESMARKLHDNAVRVSTLKARGQVYVFTFNSYQGCYEVRVDGKDEIITRYNTRKVNQAKTWFKEEHIMDRWHIFRRGSNAANQSMRNLAYLGTIEANDHDSAWRMAHDEFTCYNNQSLEAYRDSGSHRGLPKGYWDMVIGQLFTLERATK